MYSILSNNTFHLVVPIKINYNALLTFLYCDAIIIAYSLSFHIIANQSKLKTNEDKKIDYSVHCHVIDDLVYYLMLRTVVYFSDIADLLICDSSDY